eukprot:1372944-Rhodomonas_salina.2
MLAHNLCSLGWSSGGVIHSCCASWLPANQFAAPPGSPTRATNSRLPEPTAPVCFPPAREYISRPQLPEVPEHSAAQTASVTFLRRIWIRKRNLIRALQHPVPPRLLFSVLAPANPSNRWV